jgi:hypothetical protein
VVVDETLDGEAHDAVGWWRQGVYRRIVRERAHRFLQHVLGLGNRVEQARRPTDLDRLGSRADPECLHQPGPSDAGNSVDDDEIDTGLVGVDDPRVRVALLEHQHDHVLDAVGCRRPAPRPMDSEAPPRPTVTRSPS